MYTMAMFKMSNLIHIQIPKDHTTTVEICWIRQRPLERHRPLEPVEPMGHHTQQLPEAHITTITIYWPLLAPEQPVAEPQVPEPVAEQDLGHTHQLAEASTTITVSSRTLERRTVSEDRFRMSIFRKEEEDL